MVNSDTPYFVTLKDRGLVHVEGPDRHDFLQALITNDIAKAGSGKILYACLLTPQGKFLHDFFIHDTGDAFLLDCEGGERAQDLYNRLNQFRLRKNVQLSVEQGNEVYSILPSNIPTFQHSSLPDPRHNALGFRSFKKPDIEERPFEDWDKHRISLRIPDGSRDLWIERSTLHEGRIDALHGIDWNKGCYMGQELTARMHHRGLAKKHLYVVHSSVSSPRKRGPDDTNEEGSRLRGKDNSYFPDPFTALDNGGQMRSSCDDIGLALLKDDTVKDMKKNNAGYVTL